MDRLAAIKEIIAASLFHLDLDTQYAALLKAAIFIEKGKSETRSQKADSRQWGLLPGLCCQAAGGQPSWADGAAAVWWMFYAAADLMDAVQDNDPPEAWWANAGPGVALSAATGLFFSASTLLQNVAGSDQVKPVGSALIDDFLKSFLLMSAGQYADLIHTQPTLEQYWEIVSSKSGAFFSLACRSGARIAMQDQEKLDAYGEFGRTLGMLVQVLDDLEDINLLNKSLEMPDLSKISRSLPIVYTMQVVPESQRLWLQTNLLLSERNPALGEEIFQCIEQSGAVFFLMTEIKRLREQAMTELADSGARGLARDTLAELITGMGAIPGE